MIIWRGWGILAILIGLVAGILGGGVASTFVDQDLLPFTFSLTLILAAVATWFVGSWFNKIRPQARIDEWAAARKSQLEQLVGAGQFSLGPGQPQPRSYEEAQAMADQLMEAELAATKSAFNQHSVFWIPMQYFAFVWAAVSIGCLILGFSQLSQR